MSKRLSKGACDRTHKKVRGPAKDRAPTGTAMTKHEPPQGLEARMPPHPVEVND